MNEKALAQWGAVAPKSNKKYVQILYVVERKIQQCFERVVDRFVVGKNSALRLPSCLFPDQFVSTIKGLPCV